jgi:acyl dehydratase
VQVASTVRDQVVMKAERVVTFTTDQIAAYAQASGDHNPIHLDADFARSVGLPGVIAHGMLQMGILGCVAADAAGGGGRLKRLYCRFAGMVEPGDKVTFAAEDSGPGKLALSAVNQRGEPILTKASAEYL